MFISCSSCGCSYYIWDFDSCHDIRNVRFSHVKRKGNMPAHLLAKHTCGIVDYLVWMEENPCSLEQALHHDVISFLSNESF